MRRGLFTLGVEGVQLKKPEAAGAAVMFVKRAYAPLGLTSKARILNTALLL
jgi:hypothetical protein